MGARSSGRAVALQILFSLDVVGEFDESRRRYINIEQALKQYWSSFEDVESLPGDVDYESRKFADTLLCELIPKFDAIDGVIRAASANWRLERMPYVDRNILRLATFELMHHADTPYAVTIDEAIELAKYFGTEDSAKFVNGVLERVASTLGRLKTS